MCLQNTPEFVEGYAIDDFLRQPGKPIKWPTCANIKMHAHMARHQLDGNNLKALFLSELLIDMNCKFDGEFAHIVVPKITASLKYKFDKLVKEGILMDNPAGGPRGKAVTWPSWTAMWAQPGWDGDVQRPPGNANGQAHTWPGPGVHPGAAPFPAAVANVLHVTQAAAPHNFEFPATVPDLDHKWKNKSNAGGDDGAIPHKSSSDVVVNRWLDQMQVQGNTSSPSITSQATTLVGQSSSSLSPPQAHSRPHPPPFKYSLAASRHAPASPRTTTTPRIMTARHAPFNLELEAMKSDGDKPQKPNLPLCQLPKSMHAQTSTISASKFPSYPAVATTLSAPSITDEMLLNCTQPTTIKNDAVAELNGNEFSALAAIGVAYRSPSQQMRQPTLATLSPLKSQAQILSRMSPLLSPMTPPPASTGLNTDWPMAARDWHPTAGPRMEPEPLPQPDTCTHQPSIPCKFQLEEGDSSLRRHAPLGAVPSPLLGLPPPPQSNALKTPPSLQETTLLPSPPPSVASASPSTYNLTAEYNAVLIAIKNLAHHLRRIRDTDKSKTATILHQVAELYATEDLQLLINIDHNIHRRIVQQYFQDGKTNQEFITAVAEYLAQRILELRAQHHAQQGISINSAVLKSLSMTVYLLLGVYVDVDLGVGVSGMGVGDDAVWEVSRGKTRPKEPSFAVNSTGLWYQFLPL